MTDLAEMKCISLHAGDRSLTDDEIDSFLQQLPHWHVQEVDGMKQLERSFKFTNFAEALAFTNKIGAIAEEQDHHPMIITEWGKVTLKWWTHKIGGLHKNDFIMAARSDRIAGQ